MHGSKAAGGDRRRCRCPAAAVQCVAEGTETETVTHPPERKKTPFNGDLQVDLQLRGSLSVCVGDGEICQTWRYESDVECSHQVF